jgi:PHD/YefM family antitoxin component YafN of YafNO toxin-antitoxin module
MADRSLEIVTLAEEAAELVRECEASGRRVVFLRNGRPVAILVAMDEYVALKETVSLVASEEATARIDAADEEIRRGEILLPEDLFVE